MTDTMETTTEATTETTEVTEAPEGSGPKELRDALAREKDKAHGYRVQLMVGAYKEIGLNPETGLGKAIAKEYDGDPTAEAIAEYAKTEYGYEAEVHENPQGQAIKEGQKQVDAANQQSQSITPGTEAAALQEAQASKDYATAGAIKANQLERLFKR